MTAEQASWPGRETTHFEYRVVGVEPEGDGAPERGEWFGSYDQAAIQVQDWANAEPPFADVYLERRVVTAGEPVRLDADGKPIL